mgnify:FL=1
MIASVHFTLLLPVHGAIHPLGVVRALERAAGRVRYSGLAEEGT